MHKMGELITVIENAGIFVRSARWVSEGHLNIDVADHDRAYAELVAQGWYKEGVEQHADPR